MESGVKQRGLASVEFAVVGTAFFLCVLALLEIARVMMTMNLLQNVTRTGARLAAVCPPAEQAVIKAAARQVSLVQVADNQIDIAYLDQNMVVIAPVTNNNFPNIRFVRSRIVNYQHDLLVPIVNNTWQFNGFDVVIPSESLGALPVDPAGAGGANFSCS